MQITKRAKIIWGILLLVLLASIGLLWTQQTPSPSMPPELRDVPAHALRTGAGCNNCRRGIRARSPRRQAPCSLLKRARLRPEAFCRHEALPQPCRCNTPAEYRP